MSERMAGDSNRITKTGTTTIGLTTADGVVMATDMRASLGGRLVSNKNVQKVERVHPTAAVTMAGRVGGSQSFLQTLRTEARLYETQRGEPMSMEALSTLAANLLRNGPYVGVNPLLGGVDDDGYHVYELDSGGGAMTAEYAAQGSGMPFAYGVLEQEYVADLSNEEATQVAARAVQSAVERDTASGNGVFLANITADGIEITGHEAFDEVV